MKGLARDRKKMTPKRVVCSKCGLPGGTMVDDGEDGYKHQDEKACKILQMRIRK